MIHPVCKYFPLVFAQTRSFNECPKPFLCPDEVVQLLLASIDKTFGDDVGDNISASHDDGNDLGDIILCYPDKEATVWTVAKQYGEPQKNIRAKNSIPENEDQIKKRYLII